MWHHAARTMPALHPTGYPYISRHRAGPRMPSFRAMSSVALLAVGVAFHLLYSWSVFDIYFQSPLVHGMTPVANTFEPPARRLVLFSADGLRADKFFEDSMARAPFLRSVALEKGTIGVSHTRVPTESRPGHVAMIAGFYEDVSAVTKGWKANPVEFDSVFNETSHTFGFGSPDILPMFGDGCTDAHRMDMFMYPPEFEDFGDADARGLDEWVFDRVDELLKNATNDRVIYEQMMADKLVIFLHLLGLDTNGHAHKPHSAEYLGNIKYIDAGIRGVVEKLNKFYKNDGKTSFIFTADHGMTDIGNHGDGNPQATQTPFVAWGAGIKGPKEKIAKDRIVLKELELFDYLQDLENSTRRIDLNQADIAPLMSTLIGIPYPLNSVGVLPVEYLSIPLAQAAESLFHCMHAILSQYLIKDFDKYSNGVFYKPFDKLVDWKLKFKNVGSKIEQIRDNGYVFGSGSLSEAYIFRKTFEMIDLSRSGLMYYQTYDMQFLNTVITLGYIGWIVFCSLNLLIRDHNNAELYKVPITRSTSRTIGQTNEKKVFTDLSKKRGNIFSRAKDSIIDGIYYTLESLINLFIFNRHYVITWTVYCFILHLKSSPWRHYLYGAFPVFFWCNIWSKRTLVWSMIKKIASSNKTDDSSGLFTVIFTILGYIAGLELLVYSYFNRSALTYYMIGFGLGWPLLAFDKFFWKRNFPIILLFISFTIGTSVFTSLPATLEINKNLIGLSGILFGIAIIVELIYFRQKQKVETVSSFIRDSASVKSPNGKKQLSIYKKQKGSIYQLVWLIQLLFIIGATLTTLDSVEKLQQRKGLPVVNRTISWTILTLSVCLPWVSKIFLGKESYIIQVLTVIFAFAPVFIILSVSYESIFFLTYSSTCITWMYLEADLFRYNRVLTARSTIRDINDSIKNDSTRVLSTPTAKAIPLRSPLDGKLPSPATTPTVVTDKENPFDDNSIAENELHCTMCQSKLPQHVQFKNASLLGKLSSPLSPSFAIDGEDTPLGASPIRKGYGTTSLNAHLDSNGNSTDTSPNTKFEKLRHSTKKVNPINKSPLRRKLEIDSTEESVSVDVVASKEGGTRHRLSLLRLLKHLKRDTLEVTETQYDDDETRLASKTVLSDAVLDEYREDDEVDLLVDENGQIVEAQEVVTSSMVEYRLRGGKTQDLQILNSKINHLNGCSGCTFCGHGCICGRTGELSIVHVRVALIFLLLINVGFFGTGNMASIGSFSLESVYRLITVFDPFLMGALLVFKIMIPFFVLSCVLGVLSGPVLGLGLSSIIEKAVGKSRAARQSLSSGLAIFEIVIATTDVMTLNFFYLVKNEGSWLEIGTTISHFIIASAFIILQILLFTLSKLLVSDLSVINAKKNKSSGGIKSSQLIAKQV